jgi:endonuclease/exonuclease/phosphatase family metal-dependent hydrolase
MKIIKGIFRWLNIFLVIGTILAYSAVYISPEIFWPVSFFGLALPIFLILNIISIFIFFLLKEKRGVWLNVLCLAIAVLFLSRLVGFNLSSESSNSTEFNVLTYNALNFKKLAKTKFKEGIQNYQPIFEEAKPSIFCIQEGVYSKNAADFKAFLKNNYQLAYNYQGTVGLNIYSAYPIINKDIIVGSAKRTNGCIFADLKIDTTIVRVYNLHLESTGVSEEAEVVMDNPDFENEATKQSVKNIVKIIKRANQNRAKQVEKIVSHIQNCPYPVIVCGDLNDTPFSYAYHTLSYGLKDSFSERGSGFGITYNGPIPGLRIDYILTSPQINIHSHDVSSSTLSDHYPVFSTVSL